MINLTINGQAVSGKEGQTIFEVAFENNIHIPTLCHDERVEPAGACGVCVVESDKSPRLLRACSTVIAEGMAINTDTPRVREARDSALSLLLSDHTGDCRPPCAQKCPAQTDCQGYIGLVANGAYQEALSLIREKLPLPGCIGRVCPAPCEEGCRREKVEEPVAIAHIKTFVTDTASVKLPKAKSDTGKHVGIIGGGPGGLTAAYFLRLNGHKVTIYDAMPQMGGMLRYGIPSYRLPREVIDEEIELIESLGVTMKNNVKIGEEMSFAQLQKEHDAVLIAIGAWTSAGLRCPGETLPGVVGGIDFLREVALGKAASLQNKHIAVVGGGNTAMDACRTAMRLGAASVTNIYRRTKAEMPAQAIEIKEAEEEGVIFKFLTNPLEIVEENGSAASIRLQIMELGEPDASGRRSPVPVEGAEEVINVDLVLLAIGQNVNPDGLENVELTKWRTIIADEGNFTTNIPGVFAVGDATNNGASIAIEAIGEAQKAAVVMDKFLLNGEINAFKAPFVVTDENWEVEADTPKAKREAMPHAKPDIRRKNFDPVNLGYTEAQAKAEAMRCLECGCSDYFECKLLDYARRYNIKPEYLGEKTKAAIDASHPNIIRNPEKCVLCGLCVRVCDQALDVTALGFDGRGFGTTVKPAFDEPLAESDCKGCGQCVALCPTGALAERLPLAKNVPLRESFTESHCVHCERACPVTYSSHGNLLLRAIPAKNDFLCETGRFSAINIQHNRIKKPTINGKEVSMEEAKAFIKKNAPDAIAISDKCTNEAREEITSKAKDENIYSLKTKMPEAAKLLVKQDSVNEVCALEADVMSGKVKKLMVYGDTIPAEWRDKLDLLVIADSVVSEASKVADVVLPFAAPFESTGTRAKPLKAAVKPLKELYS